MQREILGGIQKREEDVSGKMGAVEEGSVLGGRAGGQRVAGAQRAGLAAFL